MFSQEWLPHRSLIEKIKKKYPKIIIVDGGEHSSAIPEYVLRDCQSIDYVIRGEGEFSMLEFSYNMFRDQEIKKAKEESELLIKKTKTEILKEKESAIESIRKDFAGLSIIAAEKIIKRSINQKDHETLIDEVLNTELDSIKK